MWQFKIIKNISYRQIIICFQIYNGLALRQNSSSRLENYVLNFIVASTIDSTYVVTVFMIFYAVAKLVLDLPGQCCKDIWKVNNLLANSLISIKLKGIYKLMH